MRLAHLIYEIIHEFTDPIVPSVEYLLTEYNTLVNRLLLMRPESDGTVCIVPEDGILKTELRAAQIKKVMCDGGELLRASDTLRELLPNGRLYTPRDGSIAVTVNKECTVLYRALPSDADSDNYTNIEFPLDTRYIPLVRAWLWYKAYLYIGDYDSAKVYFNEYERLLADYCSENGVRE